MNWKIKAFIQGLLSTSRIGDRINHLYGSLQKTYYPKGVDYNFQELFTKLRLIESFNNNNTSTDRNFLNKNALEIGTGYFLVQPIVLKLLGWNKIVTIDITHDIFLRAVQRQLKLLLQDKYLLQIMKLSELDTSQFNDIVNKLKDANSLDHILKACNITYIAPYKFDDIQKDDMKFDFIFSKVVLEHIPPTVLSELFCYTKKWLNTGGKIVHIVNFTDHFANPGFFGDKKISEFNFLRYSDKYWNFWAGNSIAYTNRLGFPYYYQLCEEFGLTVINFIEQNYKERKPLDVKNIHQDVISKYRCKIDIHELIKVQRGIFLITHQ